jgi:hypothetical protein
LSEVPFIRTSERRDAKRCEWRWYQHWREGLVKKGKPSLPLWFGIGVHEALAQWYQVHDIRGMHPADFWIDWVGAEEEFIRTNKLGNDNFQEDEFIDAKALGETMLDGYVEKYGYDDQWDVIATEQTFQISIPNYFPDLATSAGDKRDVLAIYAGTFDGVYRDLADGKLWLMEHKTAKAITLGHLPLDDQAGGYWAVANKVLRAQRLIGQDEEIKGIMYNFLRKAMPDERERDENNQCLNKNGTVSKNQPAPLFVREPVDRTKRQRAMQLRRVQNEALRMDRLREDPDRLTKNPTRDCSWDCDLYDMCLLHDNGTDDWEDFRDSMFKRRDPYADHRKSAHTS